MTEFHDILETQLIRAADRRYGSAPPGAGRLTGPRPRMRVRLDTLLAAAAAAGAVVLLLTLGGGGASETFEGRTPAAPVAPVAAVEGTRVVVLNHTGAPGRGAAAAERLTAGGAEVVGVEDVAIDVPLGATEIQYGAGAAAAALAISRHLGGLREERDAGLRVFPIGSRTAGEAGRSDYDVAVLVGLDNEKTRLVPVDTPVAFTGRGCPAGARTLDPEDAAAAAAAVLRAWPRADGAVPRVYALAGDAAFPGRHRAAIARECGADMVARTALVALHLTGNEGDPDAEEVVLYVSRVGSSWDAWTATR